MAFEFGRRIILVAVFSLAIWLLTWFTAFALIPFTGVRFWYLFFGIAEPIVFLLAVFTNAFTFVSIVVTIQGALHVVAFILRILSVTRPFSSDELYDLVFVFLEFVAVIFYLWYAYAAFRQVQHSGDQSSLENKRK